MSEDEVGQQSHPIIAFVGAGISYNAGLPLFADLREGLFADLWRRRWLPARQKARMRDSLELLAPEYAVSLLERDSENPRGYICGLLSGAQPTTEHRLLAEAMLEHGARVYTPNFDRLLEAAVEQRDATVGVSVRRAVGQAPSPGARLLKLHGSCPDIYVSSEDVLLTIDGPWADAFMADCRRPGAHLLVWGYQGADPDLLPLVRRGVGEATRCTWIAFTEGDRQRATKLLQDVPNADLVFVEMDSQRSLATAQRVLDPNGAIELRPSPRPDRTWPEYRVQRRSTVATAVGHLGGSRLGRLAWWAAFLGGEFSAIKQLTRSYLYDSKVAQATALGLLPPLLARRPSVGGWNALLVTADGKGASSDSDRLWARYRMSASQLAAGPETVQVRLRMVSVLRARGRLADAQRVLDDITPQQQLELSATWRGLALFQQAILHRLRGKLAAARSTLDSVNSDLAAFVGANWSMWLQDEYCALAIEGDDLDAAERHARRAHELAEAYGQSRLAVSDLACRDLELLVLGGESLSAVLTEADVCRRSVRQYGVLTPVRNAWIDGACADAARRLDDQSSAERYYHRLMVSPHLPHRLAAVVGLGVMGRPLPVTDVQAIVEDVGPSRLSAAALFLERGEAIESGVRDWVESLRYGRGFTLLA